MRARAPGFRCLQRNRDASRHGCVPRLRRVGCNLHPGHRSPAQATSGGAALGAPDSRQPFVTASLQDRIEDALSRVRNNRVGADVLEADMVKDVAATPDGKVRLTLVLAPDDSASVVREVRQALQQVQGVTDVRVDVKDASQSRRPEASPPKRAATSRALPVMGQEPQSQRATTPAPTPVAYPHLGNIIAV